MDKTEDHLKKDFMPNYNNIVKYTAMQPINQIFK